MRYVTTAALALSLLATGAMAQEHHEEGHGGGHPPAGGHPGPAPGGHPSGPPPGEHPGGPAPGGRPEFHGAAPGGYGRPGPGPGPGPGFHGPGPGPGLRAGGFLADRGWRGGGHFRAGGYNYPSGWGYRRWGFGAFLPAVFLGATYYIGSYGTYGLPAPPPGYHWIRVGPDALLVRYGDGYVLDAAYGIFY